MKQIRYRLEATPAYQAAYILPKGKERTRLMLLAGKQQKESVVNVVCEGREGGPNGVPVWYVRIPGDTRLACVMKNPGYMEEVPTS